MRQNAKHLGSFEFHILKLTYSYIRNWFVVAILGSMSNDVTTP